MPHAQQQLAEFLSSFPSGAVPEAARNIARQSFVDTIAVSLAGRREPSVGLALAYTANFRDERGVAGWIDGTAYQREAGALLNAVAAHALDYDDVTPAWRGHPGAVMWPALWASAAGRRVNLRDLLDAYVLGFEVGAQVAADLATRHYLAGWHSTCTIGVIAAASACARLRRLDARQCCNAIGLAVAHASGVQANFGSMAKPFQAGFAASAAVRVVELAAAGVQAAEGALEGSNGFSGLYGGREQLAVSLPDGADPQLGIVRHGIEVKQFPNCYATHRAVEAALLLGGRLGNACEQIDRIAIEGSPGAHAPLIVGIPGSVDEARFSVEFSVACALADGALRLQSFTPEKLDDGAIRHLMAVSSVEETSDLGPRRAARVSICLKDGSRGSETVADLAGRFGDPVFMRRLEDKVRDCFAHGGLEEPSSAIWRDLLSTGRANDASLVDIEDIQAVVSSISRSSFSMNPRS